MRGCDSPARRKRRDKGGHREISTPQSCSDSEPNNFRPRAAPPTIATRSHSRRCRGCRPHKRETSPSEKIQHIEVRRTIQRRERGSSGRETTSTRGIGFASACFGPSARDSSTRDLSTTALRPPAPVGSFLWQTRACRQSASRRPDVVPPRTHRRLIFSWS